MVVKHLTAACEYTAHEGPLLPIFHYNLPTPILSWTVCTNH